MAETLVRIPWQPQCIFFLRVSSRILVLLSLCHCPFYHGLESSNPPFSICFSFLEMSTPAGISNTRYPRENIWLLVAKVLDPGLPDGRLFFGLPDEIKLQILEYLIPDDLLWTVGERNKTMQKIILNVLQVNKEMFAFCVPFFASRTTIAASTESLHTIRSDSRPDVTRYVHTLYLNSNIPAEGRNSDPNTFLLDEPALLAGPESFLGRMDGLEMYYLHVHLGYVSLPLLNLGQLVHLRGGNGVQYPYTAHFSFFHYTDKPNLVRGPNVERKYRFLRTWSIGLLANSQNIEIELSIRMEERTPGSYSYAAPTNGPLLRRGYCFEHPAAIADPQTRPQTVCLLCNLAVYCSQACLNRDFRRHQANECVFRTYGRLDNIIGSGLRGNSGTRLR